MYQDIGMWQPEGTAWLKSGQDQELAEGGRWREKCIFHGQCGQVAVEADKEHHQLQCARLSSGEIDALANKWRRQNPDVSRQEMGGEVMVVVDCRLG